MEILKLAVQPNAMITVGAGISISFVFLIFRL